MFATNCEGLAHDDTDGGAPGAVRLGRATPHHLDRGALLVQQVTRVSFTRILPKN